MPPTPPKQPNWRARYRDPETGKLRFVVLSTADAKTVDTRRDFAIDLHKTLARRRDEIAAGASRHTDADTLISAAFDRYFERWGASRAEITRRDYRDACDLFLEWAKTHSVRTVRQLTKGHLNAFAASRASAPKLAGAVTRRGKRSRAAGARAPETANRELRSLSAVLNQLRRMEVVRLTRDDIADGLQRQRAASERHDFYRAAQIAQILKACERHDADVFKFTRKNRHEHRWSGHSDPRYTPVLPVVLFVLLSGMRAKEALHVEWSDVDVEAGEIVVRAAVSKTRRPRTVDVSISPVLGVLLGNGGTGRLLAAWSKDDLQNARERLVKKYGAPSFTFQGLRRTCGTFLTCAPAIYGAASAYMSAKRLGHSVSIAERHYVGVVKVSPDARTLDDAMQLPITPGSCPRL